MAQKLFDLEKIKELTSPIGELQEKILKLKNFSGKLEEHKLTAFQNLSDEIFLTQLKEISLISDKLNEQLIKISQENYSKYLFLQDNLVKKYKEIFKENIKKLRLSHELTKKLGLYLIENKKINKTIDKSSFAASLPLNQWLEILDSLKYNTFFNLLVKKVQTYFDNLINQNLQVEMNKIPQGTDEGLINNYEQAYIKNNKLTYEKFLRELDKKLSQEELEAKTELLEKSQEKEKLEKLKKEQEEQRQSYHEYFELSKKEFERRRRKEKRRKLPEISDQSKNISKIELSNEISEKIEKFKSKFNEKFEENYSSIKNNEKDPLDLIRERKKKKEKEYKQYKGHFND